MAKKVTKTSATKASRQQVEIEAEAVAFKAIFRKRTEVSRLQKAYAESKDLALRDKKAFDTAVSELLEIIEQADTKLPLFDGDGDDETEAA